MAQLKFQIVTPEKSLLQEEVDSLSCPTSTGQITILPGHVPLISALDHGELIVRNGGQEKFIAVSGGFVEVRPGNEVIILADSAEHAEEIDENRADQALKRAKELMASDSRLSKTQYAAVSASFQKNLVRTKVAKRKRHGR